MLAKLIKKRVKEMKSKFPICYETHGKPDNPCIILITGIGGQLIQWSQSFIDGLVKNNLYLVTFDNRDSGLSKYYDDLGAPDLAEAIQTKQAGKIFKPPYTFNDMANDIVLLMDELSVQKAHVLGSSMGGMIAQILAINHPERMLSLILIATSSGDPHLPPPAPKVQQFMAASFSIKKEGLSSWSEDKIELFKIYDPFFFNKEKTKKLSEKLYERIGSPDGFKRQLLAYLSEEPRGERLRKVSVSSLIVHGTQDPAFPIEHGTYLHEVLTESRLEFIEKMGHLVSDELCPAIVDIICDFIEKNSLTDIMNSKPRNSSFSNSGSGVTVMGS